MKTALLGIDVGTSACKVAAFDLEGRVLAQAAESYPVLYPQPGWAEQDPQQWWEAVCRALRRLWESGAVAPGEVAGVGIDGQSWSAIPLDKEGRALCNTPIWMDTRAGSLCQELEARVGGGKIFACSGNPLSASYTLPKVLWYKEHLPQVYEKAEKVLQSNGYLAFRLTGAVTQDKSQGYGWACYNVAYTRSAVDKAVYWRFAVQRSATTLPLKPYHGRCGRMPPLCWDIWNQRVPIWYFVFFRAVIPDNGISQRN